MTKQIDGLDTWLDTCEKRAADVLNKHGISTQWPGFLGLTRNPSMEDFVATLKPKEYSEYRENLAKALNIQVDSLDAILNNKEVCDAASMLFWVHNLRDSLTNGGDTRDVAYQAVCLAQEAHRKNILIGMGVESGARKGGMSRKIPIQMYQETVNTIASGASSRLSYTQICIRAGRRLKRHYKTVQKHTTDPRKKK